LNSDLDTITAIATPVGTGGIGIIRISGQKAFKIAANIFQKKKTAHQIAPDSYDFLSTSHRIHYGHILDGHGRIADEVLVAVMKAPKTYTREDIIEIHSHSGLVVLQKILDIIIEQGARIALPGEFTKRAFLSQRIDLTQAEAVIDVINAKSEQSLRYATQHLSGNLRFKVEALIGTLKALIAENETSIDFEDQIDGGEIELDNLAKIENTLGQVKDLILQHHEKNYFRDGAKLVVVGQPNVGKSSLLNCMLQRERAIVTPIPGTTRDVIEDTILIKGLPIIIADTAGIHNTVDAIEKIGIDKAYEQIENSDIIIFMIDCLKAGNGLDHEILAQIKKDAIIIAINKIDMCQDDKIAYLKSRFKGKPVVPISALHNQGVDALKEAIYEILNQKGCRSATGDEIIPNRRQAQHLRDAAEELKKVILSDGPEKPLQPELVTIHLNSALNYLVNIIGKHDQDDILDLIFENFCIGK
jgi:tRNA modification GTPase